jgi:hypothetical protein
MDTGQVGPVTVLFGGAIQPDRARVRQMRRLIVFGEVRANRGRQCAPNLVYIMQELASLYGRMHYPGRSRSLQRAEGARSTRGMA